MDRIANMLSIVSKGGFRVGLLGGILVFSGENFGNFQLFEQLSVHREASKILCLLVTVMLLLKVRQLKSAEYKNTACVENILSNLLVLLLGSTCFYEKCL